MSNLGKDLKEVEKRISKVLNDDEYIPQRFSFWNAVSYGSGMVLLASLGFPYSKKSFVAQRICQGLTVLTAYKMNQEMAKVLNYVVNPVEAKWNRSCSEWLKEDL